MIAQLDKSISFRHAGVMMEELFLQGVYQDRKKRETVLDGIKDELKNRFKDDEVKRREFGKVIVKWQTVKVYETDRLALNEYLNDLGILVLVANINAKRLSPSDLQRIEECRLPAKKYIRFTPNANGKVECQLPDFQDWDETDLTSYWLENKRVFTALEKQVEATKKEMLKCPLLRQEGKIKTAYGTVSLLENKPDYDVSAIRFQEGNDFLIQHSDVDMQELDRYVERGFVSRKEIEQFRKVVDIQLRFIVIERSVEKEQYRFFQDRLTRYFEHQSRFEM